MIWNVLGQECLQEAVGQSVLDRLSNLLPTFAERGGVDVYSTTTISRVFHAFVGASKLRDRVFRELFLSRLSPQRLAELARHFDIATVGKPFATLVSDVSSLRWSDPRVTSAFCAWANLPDTGSSDSAEHFPAKQELFAAQTPYKPLQDYQARIYFEAVSRLESPRVRFLIQMPTGSGKTRTAMEIICSVLNGDLPNGLRSIVWIAHSEELCSQAMSCFLELWGHVGNRNITCHRLWGTGGRLPLEEANPTFTVAGFQKLNSELHRNTSVFQAFSQSVRLVVVDEAHKVMAPTYEETTNALLAGGGNLIGLTATPGRSASDSEANRCLAEYFHTDILRLEDPQGGSIIQMLRRRGVLSTLSLQPLITTFRYQTTNAQRRYLASHFDLPPELLTTIAQDDLRNVEIVKRLLEECKHNRQIIFFACNVDHSKFICALLTYFGVAAAHVDGDTESNRRASIIRGFRSGSLRVVCNFGILTTGFDAPKTDVVFIARPTTSVVLYGQMIGRGLRGPKLGGTSACTLVDVRDNIEGLVGQADLYEYFNDYWEPPNQF